MDQGGTISLLPESRRKLEISIPGENRPLYMGAAVIFISLLLFVVLKLYTSSLNAQLMELENEINTTESQRDKQFEKEALLLNKQLALVGSLLQNHLIWSNVLISVQNLAPSQVQMKTVLGDVSENKLEVVGRAANFTTIAKQMAALLSNEAITDVSLDKASSFSTGGLEYSMRIVFDKNKFLLTKEK